MSNRKFFLFTDSTDGIHGGLTDQGKMPKDEVEEITKGEGKLVHVINGDDLEGGVLPQVTQQFLIATCDLSEDFQDLLLSLLAAAYQAGLESRRR